MTSEARHLLFRTQTTKQIPRGVRPLGMTRIDDLTAHLKASCHFKTPAPDYMRNCDKMLTPEAPRLARLETYMAWSAAA